MAAVYYAILEIRGADSLVRINDMQKDGTD